MITSSSYESRRAPRPRGLSSPNNAETIAWHLACFESSAKGVLGIMLKGKLLTFDLLIERDPHFTQTW